MSEKLKLDKVAVAYLRVSTKRQAKKGYDPDGYSIPAQKNDCIAKAILLGAQIVMFFIDKGESARTADRPEFKKMLAYLEENPVDYVIVHKLDRFARDREDDVLLTKQIRQTGADLVSTKEGIDNTPAGRMMHGIIAAVNEYYSANLEQEVKKGMRQKVQ